MSVSICQGVRHANNWISGLRTPLTELMECFFDGRNVFIWDVLSLGFIFENIAQLSILSRDVIIQRGYVSDNFGVLAGTSRLFLVEVCELCFATY